MSAQHASRVAAPTSRGERIAYFDVAKGIAIAIVVIFHTSLGFVSAKIISDLPLLNFTATFAYGFAVQIFFAFAGYFSVRALTRPNFLRDRMLGLYYPYLLWSAISLSAALAASGSTNSHYSLSTFLTLPLWPILHYWFLLALMASLLLLYIFRTLRGLIVSAAVALLVSDFLPGWLHDAAYFWPFTAAGALFAMRGSLPALRPGIAVLCFLLLIGGTFLAIEAGIDLFYVRIVPFIPFSFAGCYALLYVSEGIVRNRVGRVFAYLGKRSLTIYLMHVLVAAGLRTVIYKIDPSFDPVTAMTACFIAAIGVSVLAHEMAARLRLSKLAGFEPLLSERQPAPKTKLAPTVIS